MAIVRGRGGNAALAQLSRAGPRQLRYPCNGQLIRRAHEMILKSVFGLSLVLHASLDPQVSLKIDPGAWQQLSAPQREAALLPAVQRATDCIVQKFVADPRYRGDLRSDEVNDLIVDSIAGCGPPVRAMIDAHDRIYGAGSGEAFLLGPYLDVLPSAVVHQVRAKAH